MATLERIRRRSGLLLIVIGLAMLAFILTDLFSSGDSLLRGDATVVGKVGNSKIEYQEFNQKIDQRLSMLQQQNPQQFSNISRLTVAEQIWTEFLQEQILGERYEELGIQVTDEELINRIKNNPQIRDQQNFKDPVTGKFSMSAFQNYVENIRDQANQDAQAAQMYQQWISFEEAIYDQALREKYQQAVRKGLYMPKALARTMYDRRQETSMIQFFGLEYSGMADSAVSYEQSDLRKYYSKHKEQYKREERRDIAYVTFPVQPSSKDRTAIKNELKGYLKPEILKSRGQVDTLPSFYETNNDSIFAVARSDARVQAEYLTEDQLPAPLDSILMRKDTGYIHGPYEDRNQFALSKISAITNIPDSVNARHILISFEGAGQGRSQSTRQPQAAQQLADSLFKRFKEDTTGFSSTARELSDDPGSGAKGGALGWFDRAAMVKPFSRYAFLNETGDVGMVFSQFGFHIINILEQNGSNKAIKLVSIRRDIVASESTRDSIYNAANRFASEASSADDFGAAAAEMGYSARPVTDLEPLQEQILGVGKNREIVTWAFKEETVEGEVNLFNNNNQSYVVATVTDKRKDGLAELEEVEEEIATEVIKQKKAEVLKERINAANPGNGDITAFASALDVAVKSQNVNFATSNLTDFGTEPKVIGRVTAMPVNELSKPIAGDRGVYVVRIIQRQPADELASYESEQIRMQTEMANLAPNEIFESLKKQADIEDNRAKFY